MSWADVELDDLHDHKFDEESHTVEWGDDHGRVSFSLSEFIRLPPAYGRKFALLHLIQAAELLLKSYVEQVQPGAIFVSPSSRRTITLKDALDFVLMRKPTLLSPDEVLLLLEAKDIRNDIEHYQFQSDDSKVKQLCVDFLALCVLFAQDLLSMNLIELFSWDELRNREDPVGEYLGYLLSGISPIGRLSAAKAGTLWATENPSARVFLCLNCGARSLSASRGMCMGCGVEGDERASELIEDLEEITTRMLELEALRG